MTHKVLSHLELLIKRYPELSDCRPDIESAYEIISKCYEDGKKLLVAGNGGSAADAEHIVGELMKGFKLKRRCPPEFAQKLIQIDEEAGKHLVNCIQCGLPAIALNGHPALSTAFNNDVDATVGFGQQVYGYGKPGDVLFAISTSGNSKNIAYACIIAKALDMKIIGLTGKNKNMFSKLSDIAICVPQTETYMVQELHLPVYHCLCLMLEERFFGI